jgi:nucleotide-binding universal stress UspA family protein
VSIFPTKILLATEGSEEAQLALRVAVELANSTNSQLHLSLSICRIFRATSNYSKKRTGSPNGTASRH